MPGAFPASQRVRKRSEYQRIQSSARRVATPHFVLLIAARDPSQADSPRLGITVSRRIGNAVTRNRAKRLIRAAFRETRELWEPGIDVVVIVRRPPEDLTSDQVAAEWRRMSRAITQRIGQARADLTRRPSPT